MNKLNKGHKSVSVASWFRIWSLLHLIIHVENTHGTDLRCIMTTKEIVTKLQTHISQDTWPALFYFKSIDFDFQREKTI